uniref:F-box domain-containing protein n=1 Tax=Steinernema glaseri TaxID=37863 RepID=A0A1I7ZQQ5_9BILA
MDHLWYDLVEEIVSYLPRSDVETIARVAARSPRLQNWSMASEDQLEHRFLLDVHVRFQGFDREEKEAERSPQIHLSAQKLLSEGVEEEWDFRSWRYAWIQNLHIRASLRDDPSELTGPIEEFKESDIHQVLRVVSLTVDLTVRTFFSIGYNCDSTPRELAYLLRKTIDATQKDFVMVHVDSEHDDAIGGFIADIIKRGAFLEGFYFFDHFLPQRGVCEAIASLFAKTRGRPLTVHLPKVPLEASGMVLIIDAWLQSDGTFEDKAVASDAWGWRAFVWPTFKEKYKTIIQEQYGRYLAHPTKRSSLYISLNKIRTMEFKPWHVPVDFKWIDALITKWRAGWGFYAWRTETTFTFNFKAADDWKNLVKKYGPALWPDRSLLPLAHPKSPSFLEVIKSDNWFQIRLKHELLTLHTLKSLISKWKQGTGEALVNGVTKIEVEMRLSNDWSMPRSYSHPHRNTRCLVLKRPAIGRGFMTVVVRICIAPIDPEEVQDWNFKLLFGSLQV